MFDNLIGQEEVKALLEGDLRGGSLPPSMLFSGPPASGKLTTALELARVLSCEGNDRGAWSCPCASCAQHRALTSPDLLLFGRRSFPEEIPAARETLVRAPGKAGAFFFVRAVRKLTKRFDPLLWEGEEAKLGKAAPIVADIEERLALIVPTPVQEGEREGAAKAASDIVAAARKLEGILPDMPPVAMVRHAEGWARLAPWGLRKTIIIENADAMNESARNALLKILEEPPRALSFVLLSSRRSALLKTILSRVRCYPFAARDGAASSLVLERVFRAHEAATLEGAGPAVLSIERWLESRRPFPPTRAREIALALLSAILGERVALGARHAGPLGALGDTALAERLDLTAAFALVRDVTKDLGQKDDDYATSFSAILEAMEGVLGEFLRAEDLAAAELQFMARLAGLLREAKTSRETFNLQAGLLLESLAYRARDLP
jgi:DNA polymerase-3 subunit gamma/tau